MVRLAIRDARLAMGLTQSTVADAMEWSLSKVMRIENGEVTISQNDLRPLLAYLGVRDKARVDELVQAVKASKQRRRWWEGSRFAGLLTPAMQQWFSYEAEASTMLIYCAVNFPGFLQTAQFAGQVLGFFDDVLSPEAMAACVETRAMRRRALESRGTRPDARVILDESVLFRTQGRLDVLAAAGLGHEGDRRGLADGAHRAVRPAGGRHRELGDLLPRCRGHRACGALPRELDQRRDHRRPDEPGTASGAMGEDLARRIRRGSVEGNDRDPRERAPALSKRVARHGRVMACLGPRRCRCSAMSTTR
ncbi:helix-turn-helix transcriptional regulator [Dactylosporangium aurantiacum]|uniref:Helix-turn-helix transcriptional regulator n=1 Tax=Dactylosporangium aurantiacum TaxID=35754 RepID=A0A9Q9MP53_9ACTN|nr:helix-turn-helix transcriptional regulator [Dactylosporangium aurantiacum]